MLDQLPSTRQEFLVNRFLTDPALAKQTLITQSCEVRNMLRQRGTQTGLLVSRMITFTTTFCHSLAF